MVVAIFLALRSRSKIGVKVKYRLAAVDIVGIGLSRAAKGFTVNGVWTNIGFYLSDKVVCALVTRSHADNFDNFSLPNIVTDAIKVYKV